MKGCVILCYTELNEGWIKLTMIPCPLHLGYSSSSHLGPRQLEQRVQRLEVEVGVGVGEGRDRTG